MFDLKRFVTSPRGLKQVGIGTVTWMVYEVGVYMYMSGGNKTGGHLHLCFLFVLCRSVVSISLNVPS